MKNSFCSQSTLLSREREIADLPHHASPRLVYAKPSFLNFLSEAVEGERQAVYHYEHGQLAGFLPYFLLERGPGVVINSLPWFGSHGGCYVHDSADPEKVRRQLLRKFKEILRGEKRLQTSTISLSPFEQAYVELYIEELEPAAIDKRLGQITTLPERRGHTDEADISQALMGLMKQTARRSLRKGLKQNFEFVADTSDAAWEFLYEIHCDNMKAIGGRPKEWRHICAMRGHLAEEARIWTAKLKEEPVAALLCLFSPPCAEYILPTIKHEYRPLQPLSFLIHQGMIAAVKEGFSYWNFGGTWPAQKSLHHFKLGWGAEDAPYTYIINTGPRFSGVTPELARDYPFYYFYPFQANVV